ncbi:MAG: response regulator [Bacteroidota bacterium]|nr:response regulator [Bacteroidota bacterium]
MKTLNRILLVDDDELFNYIHKEILKNLKVAGKIEVAINGREALKFFKEDNAEQYPDLVLLDIDMPIMNGFEFLQEMSDNFKNILETTKVIMLTSSLNERDMKKANEYNVSGYLNKPLTIEKFKEIINNFK